MSTPPVTLMTEVSKKATSCRCGWTGKGEHMCHACGKKPGSFRIYVPHFRFSLAGAQLKFSARDTWGCDECWVIFSEKLAESRRKDQSDPKPHQ